MNLNPFLALRKLNGFCVGIRLWFILLSILDYVASNGMRTDELERIWNETAVAK
jgi:hypothetical protein